MVPIALASRDLAGCIRSLLTGSAVMDPSLHHHSHLMLSECATRINLWMSSGLCVQIRTSKTNPTAYWFSARESDRCTEVVRPKTRKTDVNAATVVGVAHFVSELASARVSSSSRSYTWLLLKEPYESFLASQDAPLQEQTPQASNIDQNLHPEM